MIFDSSLNEAHQLDRIADTHLKYKRFDESIKCHEKASEKLTEALAITTNPKAIESIKLQQEFHLRQQRIIKMKKDDYELKTKKEEKDLAVLLRKDLLENKPQGLQTLKSAIHKNFEEADSLLEILLTKSEKLHIHKMSSLMAEKFSKEDHKSKDEQRIEGSKLPKDTTTVIEELNTVNHQLRILVQQLLQQLDQKTRENEYQKERLDALEAELHSYTCDNEQHQAQQAHHRPGGSGAIRKNSLHVMTDSTGENYSPFVCSPCSELSPVAGDRTLPSLPPLEMPTFDYDLLKKK